MIDWDVVEYTVAEAKGIGFDGCHKIYVLMDNEQMHQMAGYGYGEDGSSLVYSSQMSADEMFATVKKWYEDSCALKFVQSVTTVLDNPNEGFENLIEQGATDQESCIECGSDWCDGYCFEEDEDDE
jgi:hypothetical protein